LVTQVDVPLPENSAALIEQIGRTFAEAHDYDAAVRLGASCAVPELADLVGLVLLNKEAPDRIEIAASDPELERSVSRLIGRVIPALTRVALRDWRRGRRFRWLSRITEVSTRFLRDEPELLKLLSRLQITSLMVVPLRAGGKLFGAMAFARTAGNDTPYRAADLATAQVVARRVALEIDNAELRERSSGEDHRRTRLEDALQKWIRVFDVAGWGAAIVDAVDLRVEAANPAFARMHGYSGPDSFLGHSYTTLLPPDQMGETARWSGESQLSEVYESVHLRLDGSSFPVLTSVTSLETGPHSRSYVVTVQDLSELKRTEERLRRAQRMEAVGRLAGGVAHEVNNMMTIILGFSDLLAAAANLPSKLRRDVDEIQKAAIRTARITQQLLAFSRQQNLQPTQILLGEVVAEMASVLRHLLPANIRVETVISPVRASVRADRAQLDQVLINLAFNARDAMPMAGTLRLESGSRWFDAEDGRRLIGVLVTSGQYAVLSVSDTGHGMDPATLARIFEPFFTTKTTGEGTGLGLATVYGIVKQSGGFVWAESTPGMGTTFTVCLPELPREVKRDGEEIAPEAPARPRGEATILLIEDEDGVRELARRVLQEGGYAVREARSGAEAMEILDASGTEVDLVLSDVIVPDMATVQLERQILERRPRLPIVYMSGYSWDDVVGRGLVPAERTFIQKPFTSAELAETVARELAAAEARGGEVTI
jgi:PAS domain S-box-containing protein